MDAVYNDDVSNLRISENLGLIPPQALGKFLQTYLLQLLSSRFYDRIAGVNRRQPNDSLRGLLRGISLDFLSLGK